MLNKASNQKACLDRSFLTSGWLRLCRRNGAGLGCQGRHSCQDTAQFPGECNESVLRQIYSNLEYRIVNNRSSDGSREIALNTLQGTCGFEWWIMNHYCFGVRSSAAETRSKVRADSMKIPRPAMRFSSSGTLALSIRFFPIQETRMNRSARPSGTCLHMS